MPVRKWLGDLVNQYPNIELANPVSDSDKGCAECKHTVFIPCFGHPYCINPKSPFYGCHYHGWDAACEFFEEGERYKEFDCQFYSKERGCELPHDTKCPYKDFN